MGIRPITVEDCDAELTRLWGLLLTESDAGQRMTIRDNIDKWLDLRLSSAEQTDNMFGGKKRVSSAT